MLKKQYRNLVSLIFLGILSNTNASQLNIGQPNLSSDISIDENISSGVIYSGTIPEDYRIFIEHNNFINSWRYPLNVETYRVSEKQKKNYARTVMSKITHSNGDSHLENQDLSIISKGSASCIEYEGLLYILTNYHVIDNHADLLFESYHDKDLDIAFIPYSIVDISYNEIISPSRCIKLNDEEPTGVYAMFQGIGDQFYRAITRRDSVMYYEKYNRMGFPVRLPFKEEEYPLWYSGLSGSVIFTEKHEFLGVLTSEEFGGNYKDDKNIILYTPKSDILEFLKKEL